MIRADPIVAGDDAVADLSTYLRLPGDGEAGLCARLLATALAHGEAFTGQLLLARQATETVAARTDWTRLAATPVAAITAVSGLAPLAAAVALPPAAYAVDIDAAGDGWVRAVACGPATRLGVTLRAGLADTWATLPDAVRQGAVRLAAHLYTNRDAAEEGPPPAAVAALWRPWRRMRMA